MTGYDGVVQYAYTVPDVDAAMTAWTSTLGIGPWFVRGPFSAAGARYRGEPTGATMTVARTFAGTVMVELIQQHDDAPSVFRELIERRGHGFHHVGVGVHDLDAALEGYTGAGHEVAFTDTLPNGARVVFVDTTGVLPGMVELIEMVPAQEGVYAKLQAASAGWDGTDPVRRD